MLRLTAIALFLLAACGGSNNPPAAEPGGPAEDAAVAPVSEAPAAAPPVADAGIIVVDAGPKATGVISMEEKDECTPVGIDFEKRARPKLKECYAAGKKKDPNLEGTVKIKMVIDVKGKIKSVKVIEKSLPDPVADCMLKVVKVTPFPEVEKCWDASITIPMTFPTPK